MKQLVARYEIISNTAVTDKGAKSVVLKTGREKSKVTITLAVKANNDKLKPLSSFHDMNVKFKIRKRILQSKIVATSNQP